MRIWGSALLLIVWGLAALARQDQPAASPPTTQNNSPAVSGQHSEDRIPPAASGEAKAGGESKLDLTPDAGGKLSQEQIEQLVRVVADKVIENQKQERDYTYIEHDVENKLDGNGQKKSTEVRTYEVLQLYGEQVYRLIEKEDKPLDSKEAAKEEEKIQKIIDKHKNESDEDRRKREEKEEKERDEGLKFLREVADAFNFRLTGTELVGGREAWAIEGEPRPGFEPHVEGAKFLSKVHGRVWIDKSDLQLAKVDIEAIDTIAIGLVLARIHKGTRVMLERTRVNDEVWLPRHVIFKWDARIALFKGYKLDGEQTFRDYKKFRTSSRIVRVGETEEQK